MSTSFDAQRFRLLAAKRGLRLGTPLTALATTESTNDLALEAARQGAPDGALFVADHQTRGRGRHGRSFFSAPGEGLLFSVLLRPRLLVTQAPALPLVAGLALRSSVAARLPAHVHLALKWPNDLLVADKKLAGILVESQVRGAELSALVLGVGLNVRTRQFPGELARSATSLELLGAAELGREELLIECLGSLERYLSRLSAQGLPALASELEQHDALRGRSVDIDGVTGRAAGLDSDGRLIVIDERGQEHRFVSGHVALLDVTPDRGPRRQPDE